MKLRTRAVVAQSDRYGRGPLSLSKAGDLMTYGSYLGTSHRQDVGDVSGIITKDHFQEKQPNRTIVAKMPVGINQVRHVQASFPTVTDLQNSRQTKSNSQMSPWCG